MDSSIRVIAWKEQGDYFPEVDTSQFLLMDYSLKVMWRVGEEFGTEWEPENSRGWIILICISNCYSLLVGKVNQIWCW